MPFDIGFFELCVVAIVALLVLGPERLPVAAKTLGRWIGKARKAFSSVKDEINRELQIEELREQIRQQQETVNELIGKKELDDLARETQKQIDETREQFNKEMKLEDPQSGCENPVEFEPLPQAKDEENASSTNTIHPPQSSSAENKEEKPS